MRCGAAAARPGYLRYRWAMPCIVGRAVAYLGAVGYSCLRGCKVDLGHFSKINAPPGLPQIIAILHGEPTFRRATESFGEPEGHLRADAARACENAVQRRR